MNQTSPPSSPVPGLTVCYTCMDSMRSLPASLASTKDLAERVLVVDSGSTDGTIEYCREHAVEVVHRDWTNMADQRQFAMRSCGDAAWVLSLDSDENLDDDLRDSIRRTLRDVDDSVDGFRMRRMTYLDGKLLRHTFQPEWRLRLVRGGAFRVEGDAVGGHDRIVVDGEIRSLEGVLLHDSWTGAQDMLARGVRYGFRASKVSRNGGTRLNLLINPASAFFKQLVLRRGFLDGWRGWVAAGGVASQALAKHLAIMERRELEREDRRSS